MIHTSDADFTLHLGRAEDTLAEMRADSVDAVVTSPPYLDARPEYPSDIEFEMVFDQLARVCAGGMAWNVGRTWKEGIEQLWWTGLIEIARYSGWEHWDTLVWVKPNANPIHGRVLANSHEYVLLFGRPGVEFYPDALRTEYAESSVPRLRRNWINGRAVKLDPATEPTPRQENELGARPRSFVSVYVGREKGNPHPAPMALELACDLVALTTPEGGSVLDPFMGSGTTALAARALGRSSVGIERFPAYCDMAAARLSQQSLFA